MIGRIIARKTTGMFNYLDNTWIDTDNTDSKPQHLEIGTLVRNLNTNRMGKIYAYTTEYNDHYGGSPDVQMVYVCGYDHENKSGFADNWYLTDIEVVQ